MKQIFSFSLVILLLFCSCTNSDTTANQETQSDIESGNLANSSSVSTQQPWLREFYVEDFRYSSIDEFCEKIDENGIDELFEFNSAFGGNPYGFNSKRRENISNILKNCVYEMYYKGEKIEPHEWTGFNVHVGQENKGEYIGAPSYCEYLVKFDAGDNKGIYVANVRFYEMSRIKKAWEEYLQNPTDMFERWQFTAIKMPIDGKEVHGVASYEYDFENGNKYFHGTWICFEYNEDVVILIDFAPIKSIKSYPLRINLDCSDYSSELAILEQEFAINDVPEIDDVDFQKNFLNDFTFKKISIQTSETDNSSQVPSFGTQ